MTSPSLLFFCFHASSLTSSFARLTRVPANMIFFSWAARQTLWRGVGHDLRGALRRGTVLTWWQITSCTKSAQVAGDFGGCLGDVQMTQFSRSIFVIDTCLAKDISRHSHFVNEGELIIPSGTRLLVYDIIEDSKTTTFHLCDCSPPEQLLVHLFPNERMPIVPVGRKCRSCDILSI